MWRELGQRILHALNEMQGHVEDIFLVTRLVGVEPLPIIVGAKLRQELDRLFLESSAAIARLQDVFANLSRRLRFPPADLSRPGSLPS